MEVGKGRGGGGGGRPTHKDQQRLPVEPAEGRMEETGKKINFDVETQRRKKMIFFSQEVMEVFFLNEYCRNRHVRRRKRGKLWSVLMPSHGLNGTGVEILMISYHPFEPSPLVGF